MSWKLVLLLYTWSTAVLLPPGTAYISMSAADDDIKVMIVSDAEFFPWLTEDDEGMSRVAGSSIFTFQKVKRGHSMAQTGENLH